MPPPGVTFVRRDTSIRLFGFRTWDSLLPWDPLAKDLPDRIALPLDQGFLDQWAGSQEGDLVVLPEAEPEGRGRPGGSATGGRRGRGRKGAAGRERGLAAARARAQAAREELVAAERELAGSEQRRQGLELLARSAEDELAVAQGLLEAARERFRGEEGRLEELRRELQEHRRAIRSVDAEARAARGRAGAVGGSLRVVRATRRVQRAEERVAAQEAALAAARRELDELAEVVASKQATLDRALSEAERARVEEVELRKRLTEARRRAARASLVLAGLEGEVPERAQGSTGEPDGPAAARWDGPPGPAAPGVEDVEREVAEAKGRLAAAESELRAAGELVETVEAERRPAQQAFLEAEAAARAADGLVAALQAELQELETAARNLAPALEDAVAETRGAAGPLERAAPVLRMGSRALAARRIRRRTRELEAALGQARGEADAARARLEEAARAAAQAREKLHQVRRIEMEARRRMVLAQRSYSEALGRLSRLKLLDPAGGERDGPALRFVIVAREHRVLGSLSFEEWAKRAAGHGRTPRFILETQGEAIWLFRGEWIVADPELSLEDLTSVIGASGGIGTGRPGLHPGLDAEAIRFVWGRDAGRCVRCGSVANLEVTHVVPPYLGGAETAANLQLLCRNCVRDQSHQL